MSTVSAAGLIPRRCAWGWLNRCSAPAALASFSGKLFVIVSSCLPVSAFPCLVLPLNAALRAQVSLPQCCLIARLANRQNRKPDRSRFPWSLVAVAATGSVGAILGGERAVEAVGRAVGWVSVCPKQASLWLRYFSSGAYAFVVCGPVTFSLGRRG